MRKTVWVIFLVLLCANAMNVFANEQDAELKPDSNYWKGYLKDTKAMILSPGHWGQSEWIATFLLMGGGLVLYSHDEDIKNWAQTHRNATSDKISNIVAPLGSVEGTIAAVGGFYLCGLSFHNQGLKKTALLNLESLAIANSFVLATKFATHRHRPETGDPPDAWDGPSFSSANLSFPSGHSASAFTVATVIASEYGRKKFIPPLVYSVATLVALSRVNDNEHWSSDVFFGSLIGYLTARTVVHSQASKPSHLVIIPFVERNYVGAFMMYHF